MGLHGSKSAIMKNRHEKTLDEIIKMLSQGQDIVAMTTRSCVQPASLHAAAEAAYRFASLLQSCCLLQDSCNIMRDITNCVAVPGHCYDSGQQGRDAEDSGRGTRCLQVWGPQHTNSRQDSIDKYWPLEVSFFKGQLLLP
jgi:hypothetical protein